MVRVNIENINRAQNYTEAVKRAEDFEIEALTDLKLPDYADHERIKNAQKVFRSNYHSMMYSMYIGLLTLLSIPSILKILVHTNKSSSNFTAYQRYMRTIYHTLNWFRSDLKPGTKAWKSIENVRKIHFHASRSASNSKVGMITQRDMVITQYGFMGFTVLSRKEVGIQCSRKDIEDFCHFWRVLGFLMGIKDEFNICCENFEETLERLEIIRSNILLQNLKNPSEEFETMTKYIVCGMTCFNPFDTYGEMIFMAKRLSGVPDYYYLQDEIPNGYDRKNLEIYNQTYLTRMFVWLSVMTRQYLTQICILRWLMNLATAINEFLIRYFPFIAFFKFGFNSYVDIK